MFGAMTYMLFSRERAVGYLEEVALSYDRLWSIAAAGQATSNIPPSVG
jgi:hypothetical protein